MYKVLIACPTHESKAYSFDRWWERVQALTFPTCEVLVVDNSPTEENADKMRAAGCPVIWDREIAADTHAMLRITHSMEIIRQRFLAGDWKWWFNLEADIIPPINVLEMMLHWGRESDWISHAYPMRGGNQTDDEQGIGCSILSRRLIQDFRFGSIGDNSPDGGLWQMVRPARKYRTMEMWGYFQVDHLQAPE